eukprot:356330-Chlamydomonas_euryale.AAC.3
MTARRAANAAPTGTPACGMDDAAAARPRRRGPPSVPLRQLYRDSTRQQLTVPQCCFDGSRSTAEATASVRLSFRVASTALKR